MTINKSKFVEKPLRRFCPKVVQKNNSSFTKN